MKIRKRYIFGVIAFIIILFSMLLQDKTGDKNVIINIDDLNSPSHKIGVLQGAASMYAGEKGFPDSKIKYFNEAIDAYLALENKKVDAVMQDKSTAQFVVNHREKLAIYNKDYGNLDIAMAVKKGNSELLAQANNFIDEYIKSGQAAESLKYWQSNSTTKELPKLPEVDNSATVLKVGTNGMIEPYSYLGNGGDLIGYDIESAKRLGIYLNRKVEFSIYNFSELISALETGKIDIVIANLNITEERAKKVDYSKPYLQTTIVPLIRADEAVNKQKITSQEEMVGKKLGILTGSMFDDIAKQKFSKSVPVYFNNFSDMLISLFQGKIDALIIDEPVMRNMRRLGNELTPIPPGLAECNYAWGFTIQNKQLADEFSGAIRAMENNGTLKQIDETWFGEDESKKVLPDKLGENRKGILKFGVYSGSMPFIYVKDNKLVGYELDLADRIGKMLGYEIVPQDMDFMGEIPSLMSGKVDFVGSAMSITSERQKTVYFTEPVYDGEVMLVINGGDTVQTKSTFWSETEKGFQRTFLDEDRYKLILQGLNITILIAFLSVVFGTILGFIVCFLRRSHKKLLNIPAKVYISIIQGIPILVLLMVLYYIVFASWEINPIIVASIAFGLDFAAYAAEMFRSGIDAVDKGQIEAAGAIGFNKVQTYVQIILPQALKHILPVYRGTVISTIKITSIVGYIAIQDLTKMSDIIRSRTYEAFFPLIATAIIYFVLAYLMANVIKLFEFRIDPLHRKRVVKGVEVK